MYPRARVKRIYGSHWLPQRRPRHCSTNVNLAFSRHVSTSTKNKVGNVGGQQGSKTISKTAVAKRYDIPLNTKDIFIHDLAATLEAHRATNRAKIIRRIGTEPPIYKDKDWKHLRNLHDHQTIQRNNPSGPGPGAPEWGRRKLGKSKISEETRIRRVECQKPLTIRRLDVGDGSSKNVISK